MNSPLSEHPEMSKNSKSGLLLLFTGNGKGKTTAALGLALRTLGHGRKVAVIQFIKSGNYTGEIAALKRFGDQIDFHVMGAGFIKGQTSKEDHEVAARKGWTLAREIIERGDHHLVILDELTYPLNYNMLDEQEILSVLANRAADVHVAVTGRNASQSLIDAADLVSEIREIKHHYHQGVKAQKSIEF